MLQSEMNVQALLERVAALSEKYERIAEITGENFNVFKILRLTTSEVRTHSALIAELLNPKGSHGQKDTFLKLFCEEFEINEFDCENAIVEVEKRIGNKSKDSTEGGNIDILVTDKKNRAIIIENKINARDQEKQLLRYYNYGEKFKSPDRFKLLYLTLDGKDATEGSKSSLMESDFRKISYKEGILHWLGVCKEKAVNHPLLRETITQYIYLIKYLTGQTMSNEMKEEIVTAITADGKKIAAAFEISNNVNAAKRRLYLEFEKELIKKVESSGVEIESHKGKGYEGFILKLPALGKKYIRIFFLQDIKDFFLDIVNPDNVGPKNLSNINDYKEKLNNKANVWETLKTDPWPRDWVGRYTKLDDFFGKSEGWSAIADKDYSIVNEVSDNIQELIQVILHQKPCTDKE